MKHDNLDKSDRLRKQSNGLAIIFPIAFVVMAIIQVVYIVIN